MKRITLLVLFLVASTSLHARVFGIASSPDLSPTAPEYDIPMFSVDSVPGCKIIKIFPLIKSVEAGSLNEAIRDLRLAAASYAASAVMGVDVEVFAAGAYATRTYYLALGTPVHLECKS